MTGCDQLAKNKPASIVVCPKGRAHLKQRGFVPRCELESWRLR